MNDKVEKHKGNKDIATRDYTNAVIKNLKMAEEIAEYVVNSSTFGAAFEKKEMIRKEDGKAQLDEDGNKIYKTVKNKNDVVAAIMIGQEIGLRPMAAIAMGGKLNSKAYTKVKRGEVLGIDPVTALDVVDIIPSSNGDVVSLGVHIITKVLIDNDVKIEFLEDFKPTYIYYKAGTYEEIDVENIDYYLITKDSTKDDVAKAKSENKVLVVRKFTRITTVQLTRNKDGVEQVIKKSYTLQQATDAGLYKGTTTDGRTVDGKDNWNNHPATMLSNRTITIAGRIIISDKLFGAYSKDEVSEFTDYEIQEDEIEDSREYDTSDREQRELDESRNSEDASKSFNNEVNEDTTK